MVPLGGLISHPTRLNPLMNVSRRSRYVSQISHSQIDNILPGAPGIHFELIDRGKNIGGRRSSLANFVIITSFYYKWSDDFV